MKPVIIHSDAEEELSSSVAFYEGRTQGLGMEFESAVETAVLAIRAAPGRYPLQKYGTRRFLIERFPFVIHYLDLPNAVWVLAFAHTSRRPGYWLTRRRGA